MRKIISSFFLSFLFSSSGAIAGECRSTVVCDYSPNISCAGSSCQGREDNQPKLIGRVQCDSTVKKCKIGDLTPRIDCVEYEPDTYHCVAHNFGPGDIQWRASDDLVGYPCFTGSNIGLGSTMAIIHDRDINGVVVITAEGANGGDRWVNTDPNRQPNPIQTSGKDQFYFESGWPQCYGQRRGILGTPR